MKLSSKRWTTSIAACAATTIAMFGSPSANASIDTIDETQLLNAAKALYDQPSAARKLANPFAVKRWKGVFLTYADSKTTTRSKTGIVYNHEARWVFRFDMNFSDLQIIGGNLFDYKGDTTVRAFFQDRMYNVYPGNSSRTIARHMQATTSSRKNTALLRMNKKENHFRFASDSPGSSILVTDMKITERGRPDSDAQEKKTIAFQRFDIRYPGTPSYFPSAMLKGQYSVPSDDFSVPQPDTSKMSMPEASEAVRKWIAQTEAARPKYFAIAGRPVPLRGRGTTEMSFDFGERTPPAKITVYWVFEISPA